jgi:hypothetical protein
MHQDDAISSFRGPKSAALATRDIGKAARRPYECRLLALSDLVISFVHAEVSPPL